MCDQLITKHLCDIHQWFATKQGVTWNKLRLRVQNYLQDSAHSFCVFKLVRHSQTTAALSAADRMSIHLHRLVGPSPFVSFPFEFAPSLFISPSATAHPHAWALATRSAGEIAVLHGSKSGPIGPERQEALASAKTGWESEDAELNVIPPK